MHEMLFPMVMYVDKTGTDQYCRYPLEPLIFTFANIKRELRNHPRAWRALGYIPDLETKSAAEKTYLRGKEKGITCDNYHQCLAMLLKPLSELEKKATWLSFAWVTR